MLRALPWTGEKMVMVHPHPRKETSESTALLSMSIAQIDEALTRFVLQDTANLRQATDQIATDDRRSASDTSSLVERVTVASLERLDDVIVDLTSVWSRLPRRGDIRVARAVNFSRCGAAKPGAYD
jgi:hypothetical protein